MYVDGYSLCGLKAHPVINFAHYSGLEKGHSKEQSSCVNLSLDILQCALII